MAKRADLNKVALRQRMRRWRCEMAAAARAEAAAAIATNALRLARPFAAVGLYASCGSEVDTAGLHTALYEAQVACAFPRNVPPEAAPPSGASAPALRFAWAPSPLALVHRPRGPAEPCGDEVALNALPLVFVPGLAFTLAGGRLGQGLGCYDRTFLELPQTLLAGLAFSGQRLAHLPTTPLDRPVDLIVSEDGILACTARGAAAAGRRSVKDDGDPQV